MSIYILINTAVVFELIIVLNGGLSKRLLQSIHDRRGSGGQSNSLVYGPSVLTMRLILAKTG